MLTGAKFSEVNAKNVFNQYDVNNSVNVIDIDLSNTFLYKEQISAGYVKYETPINNALSFDLGVRLEIHIPKATYSRQKVAVNPQLL